MLTKTLVTSIFAIALAVPAPAAAGTVEGVVVAKNQLRKAVVVAAPTGAVSTVATPRWKSTRIGARVRATTRALAGGTFAATAFRVTGRASRARVRAVVVRYDAAQQRYLVTGGGSVFAFHYSGRTLAAVAQATQPGAQIVTTVDTTAALPQAQQVTQVGVVGRLRVEGIVTALAGSTITLVVPQVGFVTLTAPAGFDLANLRQFDQVRAEVAVGATGTFTILSLKGRRATVPTAPGQNPAGDDDSDDSDDSDDDSDDDDNSGPGNGDDDSEDDD